MCKPVHGEAACAQCFQCIVQQARFGQNGPEQNTHHCHTQHARRIIDGAQHIVGANLPHQKQRQGKTAHRFQDRGADGEYECVHQRVQEHRVLQKRNVVGDAAKFRRIKSADVPVGERKEQACQKRNNSEQCKDEKGRNQGPIRIKRFFAHVAAPFYACSVFVKGTAAIRMPPLFVMSPR